MYVRSSLQGTWLVWAQTGTQLDYFSTQLPPRTQTLTLPLCRGRRYALQSLGRGSALRRFVQYGNAVSISMSPSPGPVVTRSCTGVCAGRWGTRSVYNGCSAEYTMRVAVVTLRKVDVTTLLWWWLSTERSINYCSRIFWLRTLDMHLT